MAQQPMYPAASNSPGTELSAAITASATSLTVLATTVLPPAPNLVTIGTDETAEVVRYTEVSGNTLTVERGVGGTVAKAWPKAAKVARYFTAYDHEAFRQNIVDLYTQTETVPITTTLSPGTSIITTKLAGVPTFKIGGDTLVNLLGSDGNFETDSNGDGVADGWVGAGIGRYSLDSTGAIYGGKAQVITALTGDASAERFVQKTVPTVTGKYYVLVGNVTVDAGAKGILRLHKEPSGGVNSTRDSSGVLIIKFVGDESATHRVRCYNATALGATGAVKWDGVGIYEISDELYNRIGVDINESNIRDYLPHVDGKQHVQGVAITKQGKNIAPTALDEGWSNKNGATSAVKGIYDFDVTASGAGQYRMITLSVLKNTTYTISVDHTGEIAVFRPNLSQAVLSYTSNRTGTFNSGEYDALIVVCRPKPSVGTSNFKNMQLELGDKATPFEPSDPQRLILPVTLAKVGNVRDEVTVKGNELQLVKRVEREIVLDGTLPWSCNASYAAVKRVYFTPTKPAKDGLDLAILRYDGMSLSPATTAGGIADTCQVATGSVMLNIPSTLSGWLDGINPVRKAVQALMNGWKANANNGTTYTGWVSILTGAAPTTNTEDYVAVNKAPGWTAYATVDYALATPEIKTIPVEGGITLHPGGNQITVETGVVQREKVTFSSSTKRATTANRSARILGVYKGAEPESFVMHASGAQTLPQLVNAVESGKDYYVTYIALDKYNLTANVTDISVQYKDGLSGVVSDLAKMAADGLETDSRQDFADMYIQALTENNRVDIDTIKSTGETVSGSQAKAAAVQVNLNTHVADNSKHVPHLGTTTNTGDAYKITTTESIGNNQKFTVKFNASSSTAPTLSINGATAIPIKKPNGNNAKLYASVYTLFKDGPTFILQGEGGGGAEVNGQYELMAKYMAAINYKDPIMISRGDATKLANPEAMPSIMGYRVAFSPDDSHLIIAGNSSTPGAAVFKRNGDVFTKLSNIEGYPDKLTTQKVGFSPDGRFLCASFSGAPYFQIFKRIGDTYSLISLPGSNFNQQSYAFCWNGDSSEIFITSQSTEQFTAYKVSGDTFTKINITDIPTTRVASKCEYSLDGNRVIIGYTSEPSFLFYVKNGTKYDKDTTTTAPQISGTLRDIQFSSDRKKLYVFTTDATASLYIFQVNPSGSEYTAVPTSLGLDSAFLLNGRSIAVSPDGLFLTFSSLTAPYLQSFIRRNGGYTKVSNLLPEVSAGVTQQIFSNSGEYLAISCGNSALPLLIYKYQFNAEKMDASKMIENPIYTMFGYAEADGISGDVKNVIVTN